MGADNSIERIARGDRVPWPAFTNPPSQLLDRFSTDVGRKLVYDKEPDRRARQQSAFAGVLTVAMTFAAPISLAIWTA